MIITDLKLHKDPAVFREGEMAPRAYFIPFGREDRISADREESDRVTMLSGEWLFKWKPSLYEMDDFFKEDYLPVGFSAVTVPEMGA